MGHRRCIFFWGNLKTSLTWLDIFLHVQQAASVNPGIFGFPLTSLRFLAYSAARPNTNRRQRLHQQQPVLLTNQAIKNIFKAKQTKKNLLLTSTAQQQKTTTTTATQCVSVEYACVCVCGCVWEHSPLTLKRRSTDQRSLSLSSAAMHIITEFILFSWRAPILIVFLLLIFIMFYSHGKCEETKNKTTRTWQTPVRGFVYIEFSLIFSSLMFVGQQCVCLCVCVSAVVALKGLNSCNRRRSRGKSANNYEWTNTCINAGVCVRVVCSIYSLVRLAFA